MESFTTLDQLLIRTVVASALEEEGAFPLDAVEDLVEELVDLNASRQRSLFHRGFLHALYGRDPVLHFPGENDVRRAWYLCGLLLGWLRQRKHADRLAFVEQHPEEIRSLVQNPKVPCGAMLLSSWYPVFLEAGWFGWLSEWLQGQLLHVNPDNRLKLMNRMYQDASSLLRKGRAAEAMILLQNCQVALDTFAPGEIENGDGFRGFLMRRLAQAHQAQGNFSAASALLREALAGPDFPGSAGALADLGLIEGGFRSLPAVLPTPGGQAMQTHLDGLRKGEEHFRKAVLRFPENAANAHFCLGLIGLLSGAEPAETTADHFSKALAAMLLNEEAYAEGGVIDWARFGLGLARLETADSANLQSAAERIRQAIASGIAFPNPLWVRAMRAASIFDDQAHCREIADMLITRQGKEAFPLLREAGAHRQPNLRKPFLDWLDAASIPALERYEILVQLLGAENSNAGVELDRELLDRLEMLAHDDARVRERFIQFLRKEKSWEPAWNRQEWEISLSRLHEIDGDLDLAADLLLQTFYRLREQRSDHHIAAARDLLCHLKSLNWNRDRIQELSQSLDVLEEEPLPPPAGIDLLRAGREVTILYIGGNETQKHYVENIRQISRANGRGGNETQKHYVENLQKAFASEYPGLRVQFYFPGWDSRWNEHFEKLKPMIPRFNGVVINSLVRTQLGRHLRQQCDRQHPWTPCTGRGYESMRRSILAAACAYIARVHEG